MAVTAACQIAVTFKRVDFVSFFPARENWRVRQKGQHDRWGKMNSFFFFWSNTQHKTSKRFLIKARLTVISLSYTFIIIIIPLRVFSFYKKRTILFSLSWVDEYSSVFRQGLTPTDRFDDSLGPGHQSGPIYFDLYQSNAKFDDVTGTGVDHAIDSSATPLEVDIWPVVNL